MPRSLWFLRLPLIALISVTALVLIALVQPSRLLGVELGQYPFRAWAHALAWLLQIRLRRLGDRLGKSVILVSNHVSYLDIAMLTATVGGTFVSMADVARWPIVGQAARLLSTVFIDRSQPAEAIATLNREASAVLDRGSNVILFPEGGTSQAPCQPFKSGAFHLALQTGRAVQLVAIYYDGFDTIAWGKEETFGTHFSKLCRSAGPRRCHLELLVPIDPKDFVSAGALRDHCRTLIQAALERLKLEAR